MPDQRATVVVDEREQIGLAAVDVHAVQRISDPQLIGPVGLEPAEHRRRPRRGGGGEPEPGEMPLQGAFVGCPAELSAQDPPDRGGGAVRILPAQRHRHFEHLRRGARRHPPRAGQQRVEPAGPPVPDPGHREIWTGNVRQEANVQVNDGV